MNDPQPQEPETSMTVRLAIGSVIDDRYEITEFLGSGGFARVYKARHVHMGRFVALKMLNLEPDERLAKTFEKRFLQEAKIASSIKHPNIVTIHDFGFSGPLRQPYIAMELLPGHDLETEITNQGPLPPKRAVGLTVKCLEALGQGHKKGIVHKDLKPANLFLTNPGTHEESLVVLDFGVARKNELKEGKLTNTGSFNGTPQYLSPEYIQEQIVTPALDVYQMGLILVEMLTGVPVVNVENPYECIIAHCRSELDLPEQLMAGPLGPTLRKALALDPNDRYGVGTDFRDALAALSKDEVEACTVEAADEAQEQFSPDTLPHEERLADGTPAAAADSHSDPLAPAAIIPGKKKADPITQATEFLKRKPILLAIPGGALVMMGFVVLVVLVALSGSSEDDGPEPIEDDPVAAADETETLDAKIARLETEVEEDPENIEIKSAYEAAVRQKADETNFALGKEHLEAERFNEALAAFKMISPDSPLVKRVTDEGLRQRAENAEITILLRKTRQFIVIKRWSDARQSATEVLAIDPNNADAKSYLSEIDSRSPKGGGSGRKGGRRFGSWPF